MIFPCVSVLSTTRRGLKAKVLVKVWLRPWLAAVGLIAILDGRQFVFKLHSHKIRVKRWGYFPIFYLGYTLYIAIIILFHTVKIDRNEGFLFNNVSKTTEPIEMPFWRQTVVGSTTPCIRSECTLPPPGEYN